MAEVLIALGANLGDRYETFRNALSMIHRRVGPIERFSRAYETAPMVLPGRPADTVPAYLNGAVLLRSEKQPETILGELHRIEAELGRDRSAEHERWMSRVIDLDLLAVGTISSQGPVLLPHPGIPSRDFVLLPLTEIYPSWLHPENSASASQMLRALKEQTL